MSLCSALMVIAQVALAFIPNVELVSLLCIIYTKFFGKKTPIIIYTFVLIEGCIFGFGIWWINYLYVWTILWAISMCFRNMDSLIGWATISGFFGLFFGMLTAIPYLFIGGWSMAFSYWVSGIAFDIPHCIGNILCVVVLYKPLIYLFQLFQKNEV